MNIQQRCTIAVARPELWRFLMDLPQMATCVPGVEEISALSDGNYAGRLRVKFGPISMLLAGTVTIQEQDRQNWRAALKAQARDRRIGGGADVNATMTLVENGPAATDLMIDAQARFLGKLGEFGEPIIRKQTEATIAVFARNIAQRLSGPAPLAAAQAPLQAAPAAAPVAEDKVAVDKVAPRQPKAPAKAAAEAPAKAPVRQPAPAALPAGLWIGKLIGLGLALLIFLTAHFPASVVPLWLRMIATTLAAVVLGDMVERMLRRLRQAAIIRAARAARLDRN